MTVGGLSWITCEFQASRVVIVIGVEMKKKLFKKLQTKKLKHVMYNEYYLNFEYRTF